MATVSKIVDRNGHFSANSFYRVSTVAGIATVSKQGTVFLVSVITLDGFHQAQ